MDVKGELKNIKIEKISEEDVSELVNVYIESYKGLEEYAYTHPKDVKSYINWLMKRDPEGVWKAELNGKTVGFIAVDSNWYSKRENGKVGAIHEVVVLPEYRCMGIGTRLVSMALDYFRRKGLSMAELWVGDENEDAIKLYKKMGFKEKDRYNYWVRMTKKII